MGIESRTNKAADHNPLIKHTAMKKCGAVLLALMVLVSTASGARQHKRHMAALGLSNEEQAVRNAFKKALVDSGLENAMIETGVKLTLENAADRLIPYIDSEESQFVCVAACKYAAAQVFGPQAALAAHFLCPPLCEYALAEAERRAEEERQNWK